MTFGQNFVYSALDPNRSFAISIDLVSPKSETAVAEFLLGSDASKTLVVAKGADTSKLPLETDRSLISLDIQYLDQVERFEPADYYITCQAGMKLSQLHRILSEKKLHFPFLEQDALGTVGGMIATGQIESNGGCYNISRWVLALQVIMANGEMIKTGAVTYKSVAGYDLPKLFCGSFGTLGVITSAALRVYPDGSSPFGKDMLPVSPRMPILTDIGRITMPSKRSDEIALRIKKSFDPKGLFPAITGWNG